MGLSRDRAVTPPGPGIRDNVELPRYMNRGESEGEQLHLLLPDPWVVNAAKLLVRENGDERQVVHCQDEVRQPKQEKPALVSSPGGSLCFTLNWGIILFGLVTESASNIDSLPTSVTAAGLAPLQLHLFWHNQKPMPNLLQSVARHVGREGLNVLTPSWHCLTISCLEA